MSTHVRNDGSAATRARAAHETCARESSQLTSATRHKTAERAENGQQAVRATRSDPDFSTSQEQAGAKAAQALANESTCAAPAGQDQSSSDWSDKSLSLDGFLAGRLVIRQPRRGYRAGSDAIFLAAAVPAKPGQAVLELGCGVGVALLAVGMRVGGLSLYGVERQAAYANLARQNAALNGLSAEIYTADLAALPRALQRPLDHVLMNPPYFSGSDTPAEDLGRARARHEETPLAEWIAVALRRLRPGGCLTLIHRAERLPQILAALEGRAGALAIRPIAARTGRPAERVLVQARKAARGPLRLLSPFVVHEGAQHPGDRPHFTAAAEAILWHLAALPWE